MTAAQMLRLCGMVGGALLLVLVVEWLPADEAPPAAPLALPHVARGAAGLEMKETALWAATINRRPLFTMSRRPPKSTGTHQYVDNGLPRLAGIMITPFGRRAIFMPETGKPSTLAEGATLDDNTIRQIHADRVVLSGPKGEIVLRPTYDSKQHPANFLPTPNFGQPGFNPGFQNPAGFQNPGFNPAFNPQTFQPPPAQQPDENGGEGAAAAPAVPPVPQPFMGFRGPIPRGRE